MKKGFTLVEMMIASVILTILIILVADAYGEYRGGFKNGTRVSTVDGKTGTVVGHLAFEKVSVRLLMTGPNGLEQYQEVTFYTSELKPVIEKER